MNRKEALNGFSGGLLVTLTTWLIPFGPLFGGAATSYFVGAEGRRGLRVGAEAGLVGFGLALAFARRWGGVNLLQRTLSATGVERFGLILGGAFLYVVGLSTLGGYVGVSLRESHGHDEESPLFEW